MPPLPAATASVFVETLARLHFGMLDLRGALGRRFGGMGAAVPVPSLLLEASPAAQLSASGPSAERVLEFAQRFCRRYPATVGARLHVHREIPPHAGLGSGTQLALATGRALAELSGLALDTAAIAAAVGRGRRSAVGSWTFAAGGFVLEGGRREGSDAAAPLLTHLPMPERWRCVLALPAGDPGVSGDAEVGAFARLPLPSAHDVEHVAHLVLMAILPALVEEDIAGFGRALTEVQCITGHWFAEAQGGAFAPGLSAALVRAFTEWGAPGVGQSSWGPAVYAIVGDDAAAQSLAAHARSLVGEGGRMWVTPFSREGARSWRGEINSSRQEP